MKTKRILSLLMAGALLTGALTGCGSKKDDSAQSGDSSGVITINYPTAQCGTNTSAPVCDELIKEFNEKYAGKYEIKKEDVPGDQNYIDKIKGLARAISRRLFTAAATICWIWSLPRIWQLT